MYKVSVIVPVYNTYDTIARCLDSLVNQTLSDIEIIIVNDGSPDDSQTIIDEYKAKYPSIIKCFIKENGGLSTARNYGIEKASGDYLGFVDSDDYVDIDFCERMYNKAIEMNADVVTSPITYVYKKSMYKKYYNKKRFGKNAKEDGYILRKANSFAWNKIYRRSFWLDNGFQFNQQWFEDSHLIYNVLLSANIIACVNIPFYHYVETRDGSITNSVDERIFDIFKSTDSIINYYKEHDAFDELYDDVSFICIRHLYGRIGTLHNADNRILAKRFVEKLIPYLEANFPDWKSNEFLQASENASNEWNYTQFVKRTPFLLKQYAYNSLLFNIGLKRARRKDKNKRKELLKESPNTLTAEELQEKEKKLKRKKIQRYGLWMIHDIQTLLEQMNIMSFADFGTCLGIVREQRLLRHDLDIDIGVVADISQQKAVRVAMERLGYRLWRQYIRDDYVVEESYTYNGIKVDLNYYEMTENHARTWLFYRKPNEIYTNCERDIVEMTYSPIKEVASVVVDNVPIYIPSNAEDLLVEKYGENWRTPDKAWIYWTSPAATPLDDERGYYITIRYMPKKMRSRETPAPLLFFDTEDNRLNWDLVHQYADKGFDPVVIGTSEEEKKAKKKHPRIRYYVTDIINSEFIEYIRKRVSGNDDLLACSPEGDLYQVLPIENSFDNSTEDED